MRTARRSVGGRDGGTLEDGIEQVGDVPNLLVVVIMRDVVTDERLANPLRDLGGRTNNSAGSKSSCV